MKKKLSLFLFFAFVSFAQKSNACEAGGMGTTTCSITTHLGFLGLGGTRTVSVTCSTGYYACCNTTGASCIPNTPSGGNIE